MIKNSVNNLYTGITTNPEERLSHHNKKRGSKFTKYIPDFKLVFLENYKSLMEARKREVQIKKWRRDKKESLIQKYNKGLETRKF